MGRKEDRAHAFCLVFQLPHIDVLDAESVIEGYFDGLENGKNGVGVKFVVNEFQGVIRHLSDIDDRIKRVLNDWDLSRLAAADLAILRLAVFELVFNDKVPTKVAINEAVDLAKVYSTEDSPKFINGVLGGVVKGLEANLETGE